MAKTIDRLRHSTDARRYDARARGVVALAALAVVAVGLVGCPFAGLPSSTALSATERVTVSASTSVETALDAGGASLADSTWAIYKTSDDTLLFRIAFGSAGQAERIFDNFVFAQPWLGSEIIPDGQGHATAFPGGTYVSGAYTAEQDSNVGVHGVIHGVLLGTHLGTATLSLSGTIDGDRIDGTMARTVTIFADTPFAAPGDAEFEAYALRER